MKDMIKVTGNLNVVLMDSKGIVKETRTIPNLVVTVGKNFIASRMKDATATAMSQMAVGTNNTSPVAGDTTLGTELARVVLTSTTVSTNNVAYVASYPAGTGTGALVEAGLFNAGTAGTMLARTTYAVINKGASDSLTITWTVTVG
jgi:hypothetical protein